MKLYRTFHQSEAVTKFPLKRFDGVAHHIESAAFGGAFRAEGGDNQVATRLDGAGNLRDVGHTLLGFRKKVKHRAVVPNVISEWCQLDFEDVTNKPAHSVCCRAQARLSNLDSGLRDIERGEVFISTKNKVINEGRCAAANINDGV